MTTSPPPDPEKSSSVSSKLHEKVDDLDAGLSRRDSPSERFPRLAPLLPTLSDEELIDEEETE